MIMITGTNYLKTGPDPAALQKLRTGIKSFSTIAMIFLQNYVLGS